MLIQLNNLHFSTLNKFSIFICLLLNDISSTHFTIKHHNFNFNEIGDISSILTQIVSIASFLNALHHSYMYKVYPILVQKHKFFNFVYTFL